MASSRVPTATDIDFAPQAPGSSDDGKAYVWRNAGGAYVLEERLRGLVPTAVKTTNYAAAAGDLVPVDTTSGAVTVTLPNAPADKTIVAVKHVIQGGTNTVAVACAGSDVFNKTAGATSAPLTLLAEGVLLQYKASGAIWYVIGRDLPLSQIDLRYPALVKRGRTKSSGGTVFNGILGGVCLSVTSAVAGANAIGYEPFIVDEESVTLVQFECEVTSAAAAGKLLRLALYAADIDWQPLALLYDSGTIAADTLGRKVVSPGITLPPGRYVGARQTDGTPTMRAITGNPAGHGMGNLGTNPFLGAYFKAVTFAAYTDPGTKWDSVTSNSSPMARWLLFQWTPI